MIWWYQQGLDYLGAVEADRIGSAFTYPSMATALGHVWVDDNLFAWLHLTVSGEDRLVGVYEDVDDLLAPSDDRLAAPRERPATSTAWRAEPLE